VAKPKKQKPSFDIGDLLNFLNKPEVKSATNLSQGNLTSQDVIGLVGGGQSKAAPYSGMLAQAANQKVKNDFDTIKFLADFYLPASEGQRLIQGKSEKMDPLWAAMAYLPYGKAAKKIKNVDRPIKDLLNALRSSKPLRSSVAGMNSGSTDTQYSPFDLLLMQLAGE
jgi:hypothetical protein